VVPYLDRNGGGIYQYSLALICALQKWTTNDELVLVTVNSEQKAPPHMEVGWECLSLPVTTPWSKKLDGLRAVIGEGPHRQAWRLLRDKVDKTLNRSTPSLDMNAVRIRPELHDWFRRWKLDLALYAWPTPLSFQSGTPFIMAIHDLQHRLHPEFPEVSAGGEWEGREYCLRNGTRLASLVLADSEVGRQDILDCYSRYGVTPDRVRVLPFLPAPYLKENVSESERKRVREEHGLPERYLFYPAQFWPHKNHARIVEAMSLLKKSRNVNVEMVFSGSREGTIREETFRELAALSSALGLEKQIHYVGYLPDRDISATYANAAGLVMPTFFGPTNIPVLEAWACGCPVLTSDIRGIREQAGDAAILVDPKSVASIADGMFRLWCDDSLCCTLVRRGTLRLASYTPEDFRLRLIEAVEEAKARIIRDESGSHSVSNSAYRTVLHRKIDGDRYE
jgi:glycosyltransferase involved in cell wall biosynthesis